MSSWLILIVSAQALGQAESPPPSAATVRTRGSPLPGPSNSPTPTATASAAPQPSPSEIADLERRLAALEARKSAADAKKADSSEDDENVLKVQWKNGLVGATSDGGYRIHIGGQVNVDAAWYSVPASVQNALSVPFEDGVALRRARIETDGAFWESFEFAFGADFARSSDLRAVRDDPSPNVFILNAWLGVNNLPLLDTVRIGHQKEAISFTMGTSSRSLPFMERPFMHDGITDNFIFGTGVSSRHDWYDERLMLWFGVFKPGSRTGGFAVGDGQYALDFRLYGFPLYDECAKEWVYVGVGASQRNISDDVASLSVRPLVRAGTSFEVPNLIATGELSTASPTPVLTLGSYAALGPVSFGGEFTGVWANQVLAGTRPVGDLFFHGLYAEVLCFLTPGDHQPVNRLSGGLDRVVPVSSFRPGCGNSGPGAWQLGLRYDHFNANTGSLRAGELDALTLGLNWYWTPNARLMINYVYTHLNSPTPGASGPIHGLGTRVAFDF